MKLRIGPRMVVGFLIMSGLIPSEAKKVIKFWMVTSGENHHLGCGCALLFYPKKNISLLSNRNL